MEKEQEKNAGFVSTPVEKIQESIDTDKKFAALSFRCKNCQTTKTAQMLLQAHPRTASVPLGDGRWSIRCPECGLEIGIHDPKMPSFQYTGI